MSEKWIVGLGERRTFVIRSTGETVCEAWSNELAAQIVREHNAHQAQVEALQKIMEKTDVEDEASYRSDDPAKAKC